jgi:membrane protease YdiL (CAAX protease family)
MLDTGVSSRYGRHAGEDMLSRGVVLAMLLVVGQSIVLPAVFQLVPLGWLSHVLSITETVPGLQEEVFYWLLSAIMVCILALIAAIAYLFSKHTFAETFALRPIHVRGAILTVVGTVSLFLVCFLLRGPGGSSALKVLQPGSDLLFWKTGFAWMALALVVIVGPICEELLYRGFLFSALARSPVGAIAAGMLSSLAFAVAHIHYGLGEMTIIFFNGLALCYVLYRTKTALYGVLAHVVWNALAMLPYIHRML